MLKIKHHILYKKDFKKLIKNRFDDSVLNEVILTLRKKEPARSTISRSCFERKVEAF